MPNLGGLLSRKSGRGDWIRVDTTMEFNRSAPIEYARARTVVKAREDALRQAMPEDMTLDNLICDLYGCGEYSPNAARNMFSLTSLAGYIVDEKLLHADVASFEPDRYTYRVKMRAKVQPNIGRRNPQLQLHLEVARQHLMAGEELEVQAQVSMDGHLYLFYFLFDQSVLMIHPTPGSSDRMIAANTQIDVPSAEDKERGLRYVMMADPNMEVTYETLYGVFCTEKLDKVEEFFIRPQQSGYNMLGRDNFNRFQRMLAATPVDKRVERAIQLEVQNLQPTNHFF